jgi:hypothetical protein
MKRTCLFNSFGLLFIAIIALAFSTSNPLFAEPPNSYVVPLSRTLSKSIFDLNAKPYLSPTIQVVNATSNAGFFHSAYVPRKVNKPYFRFSLNAMAGLVPDDMKTFKPQIPTREYNMSDAMQYVTLTGIDTVGLINYFLQTILYDGIYNTKTIQIPEAAPTTLGDKKPSQLLLPHDVMLDLVRNHELYPIIVAAFPEAAALIENVIGSIPPAFDLTAGGNLNIIPFGVPQLEVGSLFGTELLVRFIPPIDIGEWVGDFSFWGIGLKHSISQYFYNDTNRDGNADKREQIAPFDLAVQAVFQRTSLENTVGYTNAKLKATANIFSFNIHASKNFDNIIEAYTGLAFEMTDIVGSYTYTLPISMQVDLGLAQYNPEDPNNPIIDPENGFPGDTIPQKSDVSLVENHIKWIVGVTKNIGPVTIYADYSLSKFNIFSLGVQYRF